MRKRGREEERDKREVEIGEGRNSTPIALLAGVIEDYQNLGLSTVLPPPKDTKQHLHFRLFHTRIRTPHSNEHFIPSINRCPD